MPAHADRKKSARAKAADDGTNYTTALRALEKESVSEGQAASTLTVPENLSDLNVPIKDIDLPSEKSFDEGLTAEWGVDSGRVPLGYDDNDEMIFWDPSKDSHCVLYGSKGTGKSTLASIATYLSTFQPGGIEMVYLGSKGSDHAIYEADVHAVSSQGIRGVLEGLEIEIKERKLPLSGGGDRGDVGGVLMPRKVIILDNPGEVVTTAGKMCGARHRAAIERSVDTVIKKGPTVGVHVLLLINNPAQEPWGSDPDTVGTCDRWFDSATAKVVMTRRGIFDPHVALKIPDAGFDRIAKEPRRDGRRRAENGHGLAYFASDGKPARWFRTPRANFMNGSRLSVKRH